MRDGASVFLLVILISSFYSTTAFAQSSGTTTVALSQMTVSSTSDFTEAWYSVTTTNLQKGDWIEFILYPPQGTSFSSTDQGKISLSVDGAQLTTQLQTDATGAKDLTAKKNITFSPDYNGGSMISTLDILIPGNAPSGTYTISAVIMPELKPVASVDLEINSASSQPTNQNPTPPPITIPPTTNTQNMTTQNIATTQYRPGYLKIMVKVNDTVSDLTPQNFTMHITINPGNNKYDERPNSKGEIVFEVPVGSTYSVVAEEKDGFYVVGSPCNGSIVQEDQVGLCNILYGNKSQITGHELEDAANYYYNNEDLGPHVFVKHTEAVPKHVTFGDPVSLRLQLENVGDEPGKTKITVKLFDSTHEPPFNSLVEFTQDTPVVPAHSTSMMNINWTPKNADKYIVMVFDGPGDSFDVSNKSKNNSTSYLPPFLKNTAKWWHDGSVGDSDFTKGIQYMIQNGIITIPQTQESSTSSQHMPSWIKNNAGWWADGKIGDDQFVMGIQYMVSSGIITIQQNPGPTPLFQINPTKVAINVGMSSYATVSGKIADYQRGDPITITITSPDHATSQLTIYATATGQFTTPLEFDKNSAQGTYSVSITYNNESLGTALVTIGSTPNSENIDTVHKTNPTEVPSGVIGCAGGGEGVQAHDFAWWNTQKSQFATTENNLTILKQPTNTACGPTVGAVDILHWNATIAPGIVNGTATNLVQRLMALMHYRDGWGTTNMTIAAGLSEYINSTGNGKKLIVSVYGTEYQNGSANTNRGTVHTVHTDSINATVLQGAMAHKSNVLVILQSPDGTRSHITKLLAISNTKNSDGYYKVAFIDTQAGGIITEYLGDGNDISYGEGNTWYIVNIITVTPYVK